MFFNYFSCAFCIWFRWQPCLQHPRGASDVLSARPRQPEEDNARLVLLYLIALLSVQSAVCSHAAWRHHKFGNNLTKLLLRFNQVSIIGLLIWMYKYNYTWLCENFSFFTKVLSLVRERAVIAVSTRILQMLLQRFYNVSVYKRDLDYSLLTLPRWTYFST